MSYSQCFCSKDTKTEKQKKKVEAAAGPSSCPRCSSLAGGLTAVQHVLVLGSSFTMSAICHIAPCLLGNYSSNLKRQRYLICSLTGREWTRQSQRTLLTQSSLWIWNHLRKADKGTIWPCFPHQPVLLSLRRQISSLKAEQTVITF